MLFISYNKGTNLFMVKMSLQGPLMKTICNSLVESVSWKSRKCWKKLYFETQCVIQDPTKHKRQVCLTLLTAEECKCMVSFLEQKPGLFLDKIQDEIYNTHGALLSIQIVHNQLVNFLAINLKKTDTLNIWNWLVCKYHYFNQIWFIPPKFLVFRIHSSPQSMCIYILEVFFPSDETAICDQEILQNWACALCDPETHTVGNQNLILISLLPAISLDGPLAMDFTFDPFNGKMWKNFIK